MALGRLAATGTGEPDSTGRPEAAIGHFAAPIGPPTTAPEDWHSSYQELAVVPIASGLNHRRQA